MVAVASPRRDRTLGHRLVETRRYHWSLLSVCEGIFAT